MARFGLHAASSLIWGEAAFLFHFILSKIVVSSAAAWAEVTQRSSSPRVGTRARGGNF